MNLVKCASCGKMFSEEEVGTYEKSFCCFKCLEDIFDKEETEEEL